MRCVGCNLPLDNHNNLQCNACKARYCLKCLDVKADSTSAMTAEQLSALKCPSCVNVNAVPRKNRGDDSPARVPATAPTFVRPETTKLKQRNNKGEPPATTGTESSTLLAELRHLRQEITEVKHQNAEIKTQMTSISEHLTQTLKEQSKALQEAQLEIASLRSTVGELQQQIATREQDSLRNDLEIVGLAEGDNENLNQIVKVISTKIGVELSETDINDVSRVGPKTSKRTTSNSDKTLPRPIVLKLVRKGKRDEIIKAAKSRRNITSENVVDSKPLPLYINERLTKDNRSLFRQARLRTNEHGFRYCWIRNGGIYVRKSDGKPAIRIFTMAELDEKVGPRKPEEQTANF